MSAYEALKSSFHRIACLDEASAMLGWDAAAMMPDGGAAARGEQLAVLAGLRHEFLCAPEIGDKLAEAGEQSGWDKQNLALMREAHVRAIALPRELVEAQVRAGQVCETIWRSARKAGDFSAVREALAEVVRLTREGAVILGEALGMTPYDALMSQYQRGIGAAQAGAIFARYEAFLWEVLPRAEELQARQTHEALPAGPYPEAVQAVLARRLAEAAGLNFNAARLDISAHPFCGGTPSDIRITTRYDEGDFAAALMGVLHETGHALYEQNLPAAWARQPVGAAAGMAVHESQSLIVEMQAVRSDAYLSYLASLAAEAFGKAITPAGLKHRLRRVERSFIRVEADEMTYPAHVLLRFRLEQALLSDDLAVKDLPGAWNEGFKALLGIVPPDDAQGCLQDIHWFDGAIGYFPSYTLGAMAAAQLMAAARKALPDLDEALARGNLSPLTGWLAAHVHGRGSSAGFNDILLAATGEGLNPAYFEAHLTSRYLG
ncbi:carboxypeptidase M32 [Acidocella aminolytica]|uniref:Metal-dependent carboxypeptidase n=1 Tax=Acidocella aminolytica 101 = DSM 11237 TaxID=1120923 RepID=A0A0D6PJ20_9PROT|nr:carboxypeptidase M32 [Acidocella aminolytica]GAN81213.1 carboxypeptidase [Acidocella aminolytica 101 = DSM 11237]GBQ31887.1 carboxypeptidase [Acidocella aminolytica 101 = DSM 11237]SHE85230.1 carboxypeptidase Taq [Acidocella aminolytica 101 = DSM 11237]